MPVSGLHRQVASIALAAAAQHGFALGGGNALLAHGLTTRPTQDVDLFTDQEHGVEAATAAVERALAAAGLQAERQDDTAGLADLFPGMGQGLAEWIVTAPGGEQTVLQMAYFDRSRAPVVMEIGPVLALEDVVGGKVCALASRVEPRDYADVARMLDRYSPAELIGFAGRLDPGLTAQDFAEAGTQLDRIADEEFFRYRLSQQDIAALRTKFAVWPRTPQAVTQEVSGRPPQPDTAPEQRSGPLRDDPELGQ
jgi:multidrug efflux pump subunit AcrA (membrane-fusion protein)